MTEMYSKHASKYDSAIQDNIYNAYLERPSLQALLGNIEGLNVLDLGCGSGVYAQFLLNQGAKSVTCLDVSKEMVDLVKEKLSDSVKAYTQDLSSGLPNEDDASADVIICPLVIHYLQDLNVFFKEITRVLKANGYMVFSTHHPFIDFGSSLSGNYFEQEYVTQEWNTIDVPITVSFYRRSLTEISNSITSNGLVISQISEGKIEEGAKAISKQKYEQLANNPNFIFIKCQKA